MRNTLLLLAIVGFVASTLPVAAQPPPQGQQWLPKAYVPKGGITDNHFGPGPIEFYYQWDLVDSDSALYIPDASWTGVRVLPGGGAPPNFSGYYYYVFLWDSSSMVHHVLCWGEYDPTVGGANSLTFRFTDTPRQGMPSDPWVDAQCTNTNGSTTAVPTSWTINFHTTP